MRSHYKLWIDRQTTDLEMTYGSKYAFICISLANVCHIFILYLRISMLL